MADRNNWAAIADRFYCPVYNIDDPVGPRMCIVPTRYGGCYEGGRFAAIPIDAIDSAAFGEDLAASDWWEENRHLCGLGKTPDDAVIDWCRKHAGSLL